MKLPLLEAIFNVDVLKEIRAVLQALTGTASFCTCGLSGEIRRPFHDTVGRGWTMPRVLHVGPCNARGGMATVMRTLAEHPPDGWSAELLATYSEGGVWSKWRAYRRARRELHRWLAGTAHEPSVVHVHVASDWSWRRKARLIRFAQQHGAATVIHLHSGAFASYLDERPRHQSRFQRLMNASSTVTVVLNDHWKDKFHAHVDGLLAIPNPMPEMVSPHLGERDADHLLLLGRPDPVKGHDFAVKLMSELRQARPQLRLSMTGVEEANAEGVEALGWVSEETKTQLLNTCSALLVPSAYEGQPMVMIEALASGCPVVVSSNVPSPPETVSVASYGDQTAWVQAVLEVLDRKNDPEGLASSVSEHCIERVQRSWGRVYDQALVNRTSDA